MFNYKPKWCFPPNYYGQIWGISDSGVETFLGHPIKSLAREICQNSLDARLNNSEPAHIDFSIFEIRPEDIPDFPSLEDALKRSLEFWSQQQKSNKAKAFFNHALKILQKPILRCLRISDFNTTGLTGSREEYNSPWSNLIKSSGASDKAETNGGSFGIGKYAPYACSDLRTVIYSTSDIDGICAYQGVSRLTSFKNKENQITQGTGFYGNVKNSPVYSQISVDPNYSRNKADSGTDIFILGFNGEKGWQDQMVASILDGFLYAIYSETITVNVDNIEINKASLPGLVDTYKADFQEHADEYYQTLIDNTAARFFEKELDDDPETAGKLTLKLMIMPKFHRRVAMIRQTGMKIKDKGNISGLIPFAGILYIEGNALNSYLRSLENPQHLEWEIERADNKSKARRVLSYMTQFIKASLNEMKNDDSEEALDPSVGEYLSAIQEDESPSQDKSEAIQDSIQDFKIHISKTVRQTPISDDISINKPEGTMIANDAGTETITDLPGEGGSGSKNSKRGGDNGGGDNPGNGGGNDPIEHKASPLPIKPTNVRSVVKDKNAGEYTIIFTPSESALNGTMDIFMSAESQDYEAEILSVNCLDCPDASYNKNQITGLIFTEGKPLKISIQLDYHDYCSLEVSAHGNKI